MNEVKQIVDAYNEAVNAYEEKHKKYKESLERAQRRLDKLTRNYPTRIKMFIIPLAHAIMEKTGLKYYEIYGPFGLTSETSVYFANEGNRGDIDICNVETWSLTFTWKFGEKGELIPLVWTGEKTNEYEVGTIGYYNNMDNVYVPLPDDLDAVIKMMRHSTKDED